MRTNRDALWRVEKILREALFLWLGICLGWVGLLCGLGSFLRGGKRAGGFVQCALGGKNKG